MIEDGSEEFRTSFLCLKANKQKKGPLSFLIGFSEMSGRLKVHQITGALKGFTINFCLSHEKLKEKSVYFIQVCMYSMIFFILVKIYCIRTRIQLSHRTRLVWRKCVVPPFFVLFLCFPFSSSVSVDLSLALLE